MNDQFIAGSSELSGAVNMIKIHDNGTPGSVVFNMDTSGQTVIFRLESGGNNFIYQQTYTAKGNNEWSISVLNADGSIGK